MNRLLTDAEALNRAHDRALADAEDLRHAAIDDFWRGADALLANSADRARRSAQRLAHRLQRHTRLRESV